MSRPPPNWARRAALALALLALAAVVAPGPAGAGDAPEYAVKGAFLYNFAKFATWPEDTFASPDEPLELAVVGPPPLAAELRALEGKPVGGRPLAVRRVDRAADAPGAEILFLAGDGPRSPAARLAEVPAGRALTVGEAPGFCRAGGMVNFVLDGGRVRFEINPDAAHRAGLRLSAQLLRLARIVREE